MRILKGLITLLFIVFVFITTHKAKREILSEREIKEEAGKDAPLFDLKNLEGKEVSLKNIRGKAVILIFFATWCGPCKMELETIKEEEVDIYNYNAKLFLVSNEDKSKIQSFMEKNSFDFEVLLDEGGVVSKLYNVKAIPKTVLIDDTGKIIFSKTGTIDSFLGDVLYKIPYKLIIPREGRKIYENADIILDSIECPCRCGKTILKCDCKDCSFKTKKEGMRYYAAKLLDKEKFKKEQVIQILKWKYIENVKGEK